MASIKHCYPGFLTFLRNMLVENVSGCKTFPNEADNYYTCLYHFPILYSQGSIKMTYRSLSCWVLTLFNCFSCFIYSPNKKVALQNKCIFVPIELLFWLQSMNNRESPIVSKVNSITNIGCLKKERDRKIWMTWIYSTLKDVTMLHHGKQYIILQFTILFSIYIFLYFLYFILEGLSLNHSRPLHYNSKWSGAVFHRHICCQ